VRLLCSALYSNFQGGHCLTHVGTEGLTTAEKEELSHLRREVKVLRMEREILKRAATFFAKESV
jgi:transposase-like protein